MREANRLNRVSEYYFSRKLKEVRSLVLSGRPIINMGIGSPDLAAPDSATKALTLSLQESGVHGYQSYVGREELRVAFSEFYNKHYGVILNPVTEVLPLMGSKEGIFHISMAFVNPGDKVLIPNPGYPTYSSVTDLVGGVSVGYTLTESGLPDFASIDPKDLNDAVLMWVNYPHMPTGKCIKSDQWQLLAQFAKQHNLLLVNDNPYSFIGNERPSSLLSQLGKFGPILELNSLSKVFNMAGWRVGMICGDSSLIASVLKVKSNMDSGMFLGIQRAAIAALDAPNSWFIDLNNTYRERRLKIEELCVLLDLHPEPNQVGMFVWCKVPKGISAETLVDYYLDTYDFFIAPGIIFGSEGVDYVRFSLCVSVEQINEVIQRVKSKL